MISGESDLLATRRRRRRRANRMQRSARLCGACGLSSHAHGSFLFRLHICLSPKPPKAQAPTCLAATARLLQCIRLLQPSIHPIVSPRPWRGSSSSSSFHTSSTLTTTTTIAHSNHTNLIMSGAKTFNAHQEVYIISQDCQSQPPLMLSSRSARFPTIFSMLSLRHAVAATMTSLFQPSQSVLQAT